MPKMLEMQIQAIDNTMNMILSTKHLIISWNKIYSFASTKGALTAIK